jgi:hypothetical protein
VSDTRLVPAHYLEGIRAKLEHRRGHCMSSLNDLLATMLEEVDDPERFHARTLRHALIANPNFPEHARLAAEFFVARAGLEPLDAP